MIETPVSTSPARIARSTGAAPRQRGRREKWTFSIGSASSTSARMSWPKATTTPSSAPAPATSATSSLTGMPSSRAAAFTGLGAGAPRRLRRRSGPVTARTTSWPAAASARSTVAAASGAPRKARRARWLLGPGARGQRAAGGEGSLAQDRPSLPALVRVEPLDDEHPVEVVHLVLEAAGQQLVGLDVEWLAVEADATQVHLLRAHDRPGQAGDRQAALLVGPLAAGLDDLGVDDRGGPAAHVVDEQAALHADLGRGEAHARRRVHRLDHVLDETHERAVDRSDLHRSLAQHRVAVLADWVGGHAQSLPRLLGAAGQLPARHGTLDDRREAQGDLAGADEVAGRRAVPVGHDLDARRRVTRLGCLDAGEHGHAGVTRRAERPGVEPARRGEQLGVERQAHAAPVSLEAAAHLVRPGEQPRRGVEVRCGDEVPDARRRDDLVTLVVDHERHGAGTEAELDAHLLKERDVALLAVPEAEVLPDQHLGRAELTDEDGADEVLGRLGRPPRVERQDHDLVDAGGDEQLELVRRPGEQAGRALGPDHRGGVAVEGEHDRLEAARRRLAAQLLDDPTVPDVHAVEVPDAHDRRTRLAADPVGHVHGRPRLPAPAAGPAGPARTTAGLARSRPRRS